MTGYAIAAHLTEEQIRLYALDELDPIDRAAIEQHLIVCGPCRRRVMCADVLLLPSEPKPNPVTHIPVARHQTAEGVVELFLVTDGSTWIGRVADRHLDCGSTFAVMEDALAYCNRSFGEMYPDHSCRSSCSFEHPGAERFDR